MSQDELKKALQTARLAHERETELTYTITGFGALLRAVEILVERQDKPVADKRIGELEREQRECLSLITESLLVMPGRTLVEAVKDLIDLHGTAKNKIAELEKDKRRAEARVRAWEERTGETGPSAPRIVGAKLEPMTVDGKTPGRFYHDTRRTIWANQGHSHIEWKDLTTREQEAEEHAANAVLRAFGQPRQTTQDAVDALRRVRHAMFPNPRGQTTDPEARHRMQIIDDELAKLKAKPAPASDHAHELGSCSFCDKQPANPSPVQYANEVARYGTEVCARAGLVRNDSGSPPDTSTESGLPDAVLLEKP